jgi:hypothetical protein
MRQPLRQRDVKGMEQLKLEAVEASPTIKLTFRQLEQLGLLRRDRTKARARVATGNDKPAA